MPKVSIILPVYNGQAFLEKAIASVLGQTFLDWELLVIDDGSADNSHVIAQKFADKDPRIKIITHDQNEGLVFSLNEGLTSGSGEYIARIDCDDQWSDSTKLEQQVNIFVQHSEVSLVGTWANKISDDGKPSGQIKYPISDEGIRRGILIRNCFVHSSIIARKQLMLDCGKYRPDENLVEDYGLWLRIGLKAKVCNLPQFMVNYRVNSAGITRSRNAAQIKAAAELVSKYKNKYPNYVFARVKWGIQGLLSKF